MDRIGRLKVIFEDDWLLVLDKPAGLLTIPAPGKEGRSLVELLDAFRREKDLPSAFHPCHRLDEETSGVILFAKGKGAQKRLMDAFREREMRKTYLALVNGRPPKDSGVMTRSIEGEAAKTSYRVLEKREGYSLVEAKPHTGRTNQIRIHFKQTGNPLIGETRFAFRRDSAFRAKRTLLHAAKLAFRHPWTGVEVEFEAPLPEDMRRFLEKHP